MSFRRVSAVVGAVVLAATASVPAYAQDKKPDAPEQQQQRKLSNDERREYIALNELVDAVTAGKQPAPADVKLKFQHHFLKSNKNIYIPYTLEVSGGTFTSYPVTMYVRAARKADAGAAPAAATKGVDTTWPFADVYFLTEKSLTTAGDVSELGRALELPSGEYTLYIAMRERQPKDRKQQPKSVMLAQPLTVPEPVRKGFRQAEVRLHRVPQLPRSCFIRVFLNLPDADAQTSIEHENYAGYLAIFGHGPCYGGPGHCDIPERRPRPYDLRPRDHNTPRNHRVNVTKAAKRLIDAGASSLEITLVVIGADYCEDNDLLRLDGVSLNFLD